MMIISGELDSAKLPNASEILIWDDDHYYMANVLAEMLVHQGYKVHLVTPASKVASWTHNTMEQHRIPSASHIAWRSNNTKPKNNRNP